LDVDEGIVEQAKFVGIHIIRNAGLKNVTPRLVKWAFLMKVHHGGDGDTPPTDEPLGEFQDMLNAIQGLFGEPTCANSQKGR